MGSILSNRTDSGCVNRNDPISASRTASRFGFCQPFSDLLGPLLTFDFLNEYGILWDFWVGWIGSGGRRSITPSRGHIQSPTETVVRVSLSGLRLRGLRCRVQAPPAQRFAVPAGFPVLQHVCRRSSSNAPDAADALPLFCLAKLRARAPPSLSSPLPSTSSSLSRTRSPSSMDPRAERSEPRLRHRDGRRRRRQRVAAADQDAATTVVRS